MATLQGEGSLSLTPSPELLSSPVFLGFLPGTRASHCCGLSCCGAQALDAQAQWPWLTGPAAPWHVIFPDRGMNPCPLHRQADSQLLRHQGSPLSGLLMVPHLC